MTVTYLQGYAFAFGTVAGASAIYHIVKSPPDKYGIWTTWFLFAMVVNIVNLILLRF